MAKNWSKLYFQVIWGSNGIPELMLEKEEKANWVFFSIFPGARFTNWWRIKTFVGTFISEQYLLLIIWNNLSVFHKYANLFPRLFVFLIILQRQLWWSPPGKAGLIWGMLFALVSAHLPRSHVDRPRFFSRFNFQLGTEVVILQKNDSADHI